MSFENENIRPQHDYSINSDKENEDNLYDTQLTPSNFEHRCEDKCRPHGAKHKHFGRTAKKSGRSNLNPCASQ